MRTKYNTGDVVLIPAEILNASQNDKGVQYEINTPYRISEADIQGRASNLSALLEKVTMEAETSYRW